VVVRLETRVRLTRVVEDDLVERTARGDEVHEGVGLAPIQTGARLSEVLRRVVDGMVERGHRGDGKLRDARRHREATDPRRSIEERQAVKRIARAPGEAEVLLGRVEEKRDGRAGAGLVTEGHVLAGAGAEQVVGLNPFSLLVDFLEQEAARAGH